MTQSTDAAERSAHVYRGEAPRSARDLFAGPELGPLKLRAVAELEAEVNALRAALGLAPRQEASPRVASLSR
jgi:hypothetical protein